MLRFSLSLEGPQDEGGPSAARSTESALTAEPGREAAADGGDSATRLPTCRRGERELIVVAAASTAEALGVPTPPPRRLPSGSPSTFSFARRAISLFRRSSSSIASV